MHTQLTSPLFSQGVHEFPSSRHTAQTHRARQTQLDVQASADLTVVTVEGDTVTLSASSTLQASHMTYDARGRMQGQRFAAHTGSREFTFADDVAFAVQSELNAEELADIRSLVSSIEELATDFFSGDFDLANLGAFDLEPFDALAGFDATLAFTRQVSVAQAVATTSSRPQTEATVNPSQIDKRLDQVIDDLSKTTQRLQAVSEKITRKVPILLEDILSYLAERQRFEAPKRALATHVAEEVSESSNTPQPAPPTTDAQDATAPSAVLQDEPPPAPEVQASRRPAEGQRLAFTHTTLTQSLFQLHVRQS